MVLKLFETCLKRVWESVETLLKLFVRHVRNVCLNCFELVWEMLENVFGKRWGRCCFCLRHVWNVVWNVWNWLTLFWKKLKEFGNVWKLQLPCFCFFLKYEYLIFERLCTFSLFVMSNTSCFLKICEDEDRKMIKMHK